MNYWLKIWFLRFCWNDLWCSYLYWLHAALVKCTELILMVCRLNPCCEAMDNPYLPGGLDALDDSQTDHDPSHQQGQGHLPVQAAGVVNGAGYVESLAVPEVSGGWAFLTLWLHNYNSGEREGNAINSAQTVQCAHIQNTCNRNFKISKVRYPVCREATFRGLYSLHCWRDYSKWFPKQMNLLQVFPKIKVFLI